MCRCTYLPKVVPSLLLQCDTFVTAAAESSPTHAEARFDNSRPCLPAHELPDGDRDFGHAREHRALSHRLDVFQGRGACALQQRHLFHFGREHGCNQQIEACQHKASGAHVTARHCHSLRPNDQRKACSLCPACYGLIAVPLDPRDWTYDRRAISPPTKATSRCC